jgi:hypothetical protein
LFVEFFVARFKPTIQHIQIFILIAFLSFITIMPSLMGNEAAEALKNGERDHFEMQLLSVKMSPSAWR